MPSTAYSKRTGKKLPHLVPDHWFDHPVLGRDIRRSPSASAPKKTPRTFRRAATQVEATAPAETPQTPASGDDQKE